MGGGEGLLLIGPVVKIVDRSVLKCAAADLRADPEPYVRGSGENFEHSGKPTVANSATSASRLRPFLGPLPPRNE